MSYHRVRIRNLSPSQEDILSSLVFDWGGQGLSEVLTYSQPDLTYEPRILSQRFHEVDAFFSAPPTEDFFERLRDLDPKIQWEIFAEESKDWLEEWKKGFKPFCLTGDFWIVPSWEALPAQARRPIFIDPGMAFGTGTHATTQMAAYFVRKVAEGLLQQGAKLEELSFLDVGTGTGILAIMAHKLGFGEVSGLEIDPEARRVARENVLRNKTESVNIAETTLDQHRTKAHVVIANIIDGVLIQLRHDILRLTLEGGHLFLTGILLEREEHFYGNFIENSGLKVHRRIEQDEWVGYWLKSRSL